MRRQLALIVLCCFCSTGAALAQEPAGASAGTSVESLERELAGRIDLHMQELVERVDFSGSILVARDGLPLIAQGYGLANREHGVPCSAKTKYRLGSVTKQFTATAILLLEEDGELGVDDPLGLLLDDTPDTWSDITVHHLLAHQSGIWNMTNDPNYSGWWMMPSRPLETMLHFRDKPLDFEPGAKFSYSNSGYVLLAAIVEDISGKKWEAFLREAIFGTLGMDDSGHDTFEEILPHRATGYSKKPISKEVINAPYHNMDIPIGGGDLYSTVGDLLTWDQALYDDTLLSDASREVMFTDHKSSYGYGWIIRDMHGRKCIWHSGGINGFTTQIERYPEDRVTIIVLCNNEWSNPQRVAGVLGEMLFDERTD